MWRLLREFDFRGISDMTNSFSDGQDDFDGPESEFDPNENDQQDDDVLGEPVEDWGGGELEAAYLKALSALKASEFEMPSPVESGSQSTDLMKETESVTDAAPRVGLRREEFNSPVDEIKETESPSFVQNEHLIKSDAPPVPEFRPIPRQIIEACLFVGGTTLSSSRLATVLRGEFTSDYVDREIDELNRLYAAEGRPYEIRLAEGGYRLTLREEFERIRHKVYGLGPKEVRLSQEALEVLAVIAYYQPITQARVEELGKPGCGAVVRQLVRRELIAVNRDPAQPKEVRYQTTPRFLSLFGIRNLDELPRPEQVSYK